MLGFRSLGFGQTWWLAGDALRVPAEPRMVALAEAIGLGDLEELDRLAGRAASSALDEQLRVQMRQELRRMQRELGITFIHVTHTQLEAIALADIVVVMEKGKIKQSGPARDVYAYPRDRYVAEFLGGQNVLSGKVEKVGEGHVVLSQPNRSGIQIGLCADTRVAVGDRIDLAVRRDDIELMRVDAGGLGDGATALPSRVVAIEYQGSFVKVMLDTLPDEDFVAYIPERTFFRDPFDVGDVLLATWSAGRARVLA